MKHLKNIVILSLLFNYSILNAQIKDDIRLLEDLTNSISIGVNTKDHKLILDAFIHPNALIYSTYQGISSSNYTKELNSAQGLSDFIKNSNSKIEQRFEFVKVNKISDGRATVETYYYVTIDGKKSHKGDEFYSAIKTDKSWKFISILFTLEPWTE